MKTGNKSKNRGKLSVRALQAKAAETEKLLAAAREHAREAKAYYTLARTALKPAKKAARKARKEAKAAAKLAKNAAVRRSTPKKRVSHPDPNPPGTSPPPASRRLATLPVSPPPAGPNSDITKA